MISHFIYLRYDNQELQDALGKYIYYKAKSLKIKARILQCRNESTFGKHGSHINLQYFLLVGMQSRKAIKSQKYLPDPLHQIHSLVNVT